MTGIGSTIRILRMVGIKQNSKRISLSPEDVDIDTKEKKLSVISSIEGSEKNIKTIVDAVEQFFTNLLVEIDDWNMKVAVSSEQNKKDLKRSTK